jgi:hypothetical protein
VDDHGELQWTDGTTEVSEILGIPDEWPSGDPFP